MNFRQSVTTAELWRPEVTRSQDVGKKFEFLFFFLNDPLRENFQKRVLAGFIALPINMLSSNFVKFG